MVVAGLVAGLTLEEVGKTVVVGCLTGAAAYAGVRLMSSLLDDDGTGGDSDVVKLGNVEVSREVWETPEGRRLILNELERELDY